MNEVNRTNGARRNGTPASRPARAGDRLPPHAEEAEQGLLGCCLLDAAALGECVEKLRVVEAFYDPRHRELYQLLLAMYERQEPIDLLTVQQRLRDSGKLDAIGGSGYLTGLPDLAPSPANAGYYAGIVREKYLLRRLIQVCTGVVGDIYELSGDVDGFFDRIERELLAVNEARVAPHEVHIREALQAVVERIEDYHRGKAQMEGLSTGFEYLDNMLLGMAGGDMIVIAARPGMGKTSIGMQFVEHLACDKKIPCGVFTLEMTAKQLAARLLFQRARADFQRYRSGFMKTHVDIPKLTETNLALMRAPIYLDETAGINVLQLRARARRWHRQHDIRFLLVDYLQLMRPTRWYNNREQEVAEISGGLKALAKELNIPIVVLAQLNRELEKSPNRKPQLADLRESGAIEQDADVVAMLYQPKLKPDEIAKLEEAHSQDWSDNWRRINLLVAKQRNGPTGDCKLVYRKASMRFESVFEPKKDEKNEKPSTPEQDELLDD